MGGGRNNKGCGIGSCVCLLILAGIGGGLAYYFTKGGGDINAVAQAGKDALDFIPTLADFQKEAPFKEESPNEVPRWPHEGYGLSLEIVNALEDLWYVMMCE